MNSTLIFIFDFQYDVISTRMTNSHSHVSLPFMVTYYFIAFINFAVAEPSG